MVKKLKLIILSILIFVPEIALAAKKTVSCGSAEGITDIPAKIPELTSFFINVAQVATAVILVIMGIIDLFKGITAQKEDEMKKGQKMFIKRLTVAGLVFSVVMVVKLLIGIVSNNTTNSNIVSCIDCFVNNSCN